MVTSLNGPRGLEVDIVFEVDGALVEQLTYRQ